jgi:hypothetical protein
MDLDHIRRVPIPNEVDHIRDHYFGEISRFHIRLPLDIDLEGNDHG